MAAVLTGCRYFVRIRRSGGLQLDDLLHGGAMVGAIVYAGLDTAQVQLPYFDPSVRAEYERLAVSSSIIGFVVVLYLVKFAFLVMYRHIFRVSATFMMFWKIVCVFVVLCFLIALLSYFWICGSPFQTVNPRESIRLEFS